MSNIRLNSSDQGSVEYWARTLFNKRYETLTDEEATQAQNALMKFLLEWQEEMLEILKGG